MEKTIEILLVATVVLMTAVVVIFMLRGQVTDFDDFLEGQSDDAKCDVAEVKYENAVKCDGNSVSNSGEIGQLQDEYENKCENTDLNPCDQEQETS